MNDTLESPQAPRTISIGVDVIGQMKVLKKTFTDTYSFVGELLQNGDRAGAGRIDVSVSKKRREIVFENNGEICADLNKVFTACTSGWSDAVKKAQDPFGVGFFSVIVVSDEVEIRSGTQKATWNIKRMFEQATLDVVTVETLAPEAAVQGFAVTIRGLAASVDLDEVKNRVRKAARYLTQDVYVTGKKVKRINPLDRTYGQKGHRFCLKIDTPRFRGVLNACNAFSSLKTYYQRREVETIWIDGLAGHLFFETGVLDVRAPDRSAYLRNEKYEAVLEELKALRKRLLIKILKNGSNVDIDRYSNVILSTLKPEEYEPYLRFDLTVQDRVFIKKIQNLTDDEVKDKKADELRWEIERKINEGAFNDEVISEPGTAELVPALEAVKAIAAKPESATQSREEREDAAGARAEKDAASALIAIGMSTTTSEAPGESSTIVVPATDDSEEDGETESAEDQVDVVVDGTTEEFPPVAQIQPSPLAAGILPPIETVPADPVQAPAQPAAHTPIEPKIRAPKKKTVREAYEASREREKSGEKLSKLRKETVLVWARADEIIRFRKQIGRAVDYGLRVFIVKNKLLEDAISRQPNSVHIVELAETVHFEGEITNKKPQSPQEERALHLLRLIEEKAYGTVEGRFSICDALVRKLKLLGGQVIEEQEDDPIAFVWREKVYFPRKHLFLGDLVDLETEGLTAGDRIFLARHAVTIAHEVAHLHGFADKTLEHAEKTNDLTEVILELAFPRKGS